mgnify:CR=1 FL=1
MKKILFLHGFFSGGNCDIATTLRKDLKNEAEVLSPDIPLHPEDAIRYIRGIIDRERPDLIVGNSCGAFYAQMLSPIVGIPALLGNPYLEMSEFLGRRIGEHTYKCPRQNGINTFVIDETLVNEFRDIEKNQFSFCSEFYSDKVWGLFGDNDPIAHYRDKFLEYYSTSFTFPGSHTPTAEEVSMYYVPLVRQMLSRYPAKAERFFRHFKGNGYRLLHSAFDSETTKRMVVYQALYGDNLIWVRPEEMFFEKIERGGRVIQRFQETDSL